MPGAGHCLRGLHISPEVVVPSTSRAQGPRPPCQRSRRTPVHPSVSGHGPPSPATPPKRTWLKGRKMAGDQRPLTLAGLRAVQRAQGHSACTRQNPAQWGQPHPNVGMSPAKVVLMCGLDLQALPAGRASQRWSRTAKGLETFGVWVRRSARNRGVTGASNELPEVGTFVRTGLAG